MNYQPGDTVVWSHLSNRGRLENRVRKNRAKVLEVMGETLRLKMNNGHVNIVPVSEVAIFETGMSPAIRRWNV